MTSTIRLNGEGADPRMEDPDREISRAAPAAKEEARQPQAGPTVRPGEWWPRSVWGDPWLYRIPQMAAGG